MISPLQKLQVSPVLLFPTDITMVNPLTGFIPM